MERELLGGSSGYASLRSINPPGSKVVMGKLDNNMRDGVQFYHTTSTSLSSPTPSAKIVLRNLERCSIASTSGKQIATVPKPHWGFFANTFGDSIDCCCWSQTSRESY
jgi:hypothetical protein